MSQVDLRKIESTLGGRKILCGLELSLSESDRVEFPNPYIVLLGASGCGKSTTLRIIAGLLAADRGEVWIHGRCVDTVPARDRDVAMVFQNDALYPHLRIGQTLAIAARRQPDRRQRDAAVARAVELTRIESLVDRFPDRLSGGELRRASIAKAIARSASIRLLDEPLAALDAPVRHSLAVDLRNWHRSVSGMTIHVTHDGDEAMRMADLVAVMDQGKIIQLARPSEIYDRPASIAVACSLGLPPMNWFDAVLDQDRRAVRIAFRPERLRVVADNVATTDAMFNFQVDDENVAWRHVNDSVHVFVQVHGSSWTAVMPRETFTQAETRNLKVERQDLHCFDAVSGQRIEIAEGTSWTS